MNSNETLKQDEAFDLKEVPLNIWKEGIIQQVNLLLEPEIRSTGGCHISLWLFEGACQTATTPKADLGFGNFDLTGQSSIPFHSPLRLPQRRFTHCKILPEQGCLFAHWRVSFSRFKRCGVHSRRYFSTSNPREMNQWGTGAPLLTAPSLRFGSE